MLTNLTRRPKKERQKTTRDLGYRCNLVSDQYVASRFRDRDAQPGADQWKRGLIWRASVVPPSSHLTEQSRRRILHSLIIYIVECNAKRFAVAKMFIWDAVRWMQKLADLARGRPGKLCGALFTWARSGLRKYIYAAPSGDAGLRTFLTTSSVQVFRGPSKLPEDGSSRLRRNARRGAKSEEWDHSGTSHHELMDNNC